MKKRNVFTLLLAIGLLFALYTAYNNHAYELRLAQVDKVETATKVWPAAGDCVQTEFTGQGRMNQDDKVVMQGSCTGGSATQVFMKVTRIIGAESAILPEYGTTAYPGSEVHIRRDQITECTGN